MIVYETRFGATVSTSDEIAGVLSQEGLEVKVVNAKKEKVKDISAYNLVVIGSNMMIDRWTGEADKFLEKFRKELAKTKTALFASSVSQAIIEHEGKFEESHFGGTNTVYEGAEAAGIKEGPPGVYDTRDWEAIRKWAKELAGKV